MKTWLLDLLGVMCGHLPSWSLILFPLVLNENEKTSSSHLIRLFVLVSLVVRKGVGKIEEPWSRSPCFNF